MTVTVSIFNGVTRNLGMLVNTVDLEIVIFIAVREAAAGFDLIHSCLILSLNKHGSLPCQKNIT